MQTKGFTLIELLVTIAIAAIVAMFAVPNFTTSIRNSRTTTYANEFLTALNLARSEAIKRGVQVTMRRKGSTAGQWENGWDVFIDKDANETFNDDGDNDLCEMTNGMPAEDCLLRTYPALSSGFTLRTGGSTYQDYIAFKPNGISTVTVGDSFRLCDDSANTTTSRTIAINAVGRAWISKGTTSCP
jgi:type IV fimbrial biogenesis protein FimT